MGRQKGEYKTHEAKDAQYYDNADYAIASGSAQHPDMEKKKEWFIWEQCACCGWVMLSMAAMTLGVLSFFLGTDRSYALAGKGFPQANIPSRAQVIRLVFTSQAGKHPIWTLFDHTETGLY